jgi:hypothetical protein
MNKAAVAAPVGVMALIGSALLGASPAQAATVYHSPQGHARHGVVSADGDTATMSGVIKCFGDDGVLWASLKQGGDGDLTAEGSSATARSWYDVHIPLTCDGKRHWITAVLTKQVPNPGHPAEYKNLLDGRAHFQWCVTDNNNGAFGFSSNAGWRMVSQTG